MKIDKDTVVKIVGVAGSIGFTLFSLWNDKQKEAKQAEMIENNILNKLQNSNK